MIVLDSNVLSTMMQTAPDPAVQVWLDVQPQTSLWTTAISVFEVRYGLAILPPGKRQRSLRQAFDVAVDRVFVGRVLAFDAAAAVQTAAIASRLRSIGRPIELGDLLIAGIVASRQATLATRNTKHFADTGIPLVNPWQAGKAPTP